MVNLIIIVYFVCAGAGGRYGGEGYGESYVQEYGGACAEWNEWPADQHALIPQDKLPYPATGPCFTGMFTYELRNK